MAFVDSISPFGEEENHQVGVIEYLDGGDLQIQLREHPKHIKKLLIDILHGLAFLHRNGIIHRDLKPQNILIKNTLDGPIAITDFGISKQVDGNHTSSSLLMGTVEYMAPEQFSPKRYGINGKISTNLDLWGFRLITYQLLMDESLFGSRSRQISAEQVIAIYSTSNKWKKKSDGCL